jgi:hypothetical protein
MTNEISQRQKRADRFIRAANIGTAAMVTYPALQIGLEVTLLDYQDGDALLWPVLVSLVGLVFLICETYAILSVFRNRKADEFTLAMWHTGTTFAFFAAILWLLIGGYVEITFDAIAAGRAYEEAKAAGIEVEPVDGIGIVARYATAVIVSAFFLGLQIKRFRG